VATSSAKLGEGSGDVSGARAGTGAGTSWGAGAGEEVGEDGSNGGTGGGGSEGGVAGGGNVTGSSTSSFTPGDGIRGDSGAGTDGSMVREGVLVRSDGSGEAGEGDVQERGDSCKSPSSPSSRNSSTSQRHFTAFRVRLAGGGKAEGELTAGDGGGAGVGTGGGAGGVSKGGGVEFLGMLEVVKPVDSCTLGPETAALRRRRRRTRATGATKAERGGDREAESDTSCRPAM
jgi:hypothetical protein